MRKFFFGLLLGLGVGIAGTAFAADVTGLDSVLIGWEVQKGDEVVCKDPWAAVATKQISCR